MNGFVSHVPCLLCVCLGTPILPEALYESSFRYSFWIAWTCSKKSYREIDKAIWLSTPCQHYSVIKLSPMFFQSAAGRNHETMRRRRHFAWGSRPLETSQKGPKMCIENPQGHTEVANGKWPKPCWLIHAGQWVFFPGWMHGQRIETWGPVSWQMAWQVVNLSWGVFPFSTKTSQPLWSQFFQGSYWNPKTEAPSGIWIGEHTSSLGAHPSWWQWNRMGSGSNLMCFSEAGTFNVGNWKMCWLVVSSNKQ